MDIPRTKISRLALHQLVTDGRIHPARIEEMVEKARREVESEIKRTGERAVLDAGVHNVHPEIVKLLGRLRYRTSYGQNVLDHSLEVSYLAGTRFRTASIPKWQGAISSIFSILFPFSTLQSVINYITFFGCLLSSSALVPQIFLRNQIATLKTEKQRNPNRCFSILNCFALFNTYHFRYGRTLSCHMHYGLIHMHSLHSG